ncbi:MAG: hypothetical protein N3G22_03240 [Candidatus Micrarchaeota archaeon]|nr:hypothetical protein [Candidatus Micrarchaeota archaeon]
MKFTMSPARAYLLALWKSRRTKEGVGVEGHRELCEAFLRTCLEERLAAANKVKFEEGSPFKCYFYNSAVRAWLGEELKKRDERLKYLNEFSASYFAGLFDARGGVLKSGVPFVIGDKVDEIVLLRLGFVVKKERGKLAVVSGNFYGWISPFLKLEISKKK